jgi:hypothetical protein
MNLEVAGIAIAVIIGILFIVAGKPIYDEFFSNNTSNTNNVVTGGRKKHMERRKK